MTITYKGMPNIGRCYLLYHPDKAGDAPADKAGEQDNRDQAGVLLQGQQQGVGGRKGEQGHIHWRVHNEYTENASGNDATDKAEDNRHPVAVQLCLLNGLDVFHLVQLPVERVYEVGLTAQLRLVVRKEFLKKFIVLCHRFISFLSCSRPLESCILTASSEHAIISLISRME